MTDQTTTEAHRLVLSEALGLGTGAPWDAIRDRAAELHAATTQEPNELASLAVNAGRALLDERRHYEIACEENARLHAELETARKVERRDTERLTHLEGENARLRRAALAVPLPPVVQSPIREQLLNALDFSFCQSLGYSTPEGLLAAYEASRTQTVDQAALREIVAEAVQHGPTWTLPRSLAEEVSDAVLAVLPATTNHDTGTVLAKAADRAETVALRLRLKHDYGAANGAFEVAADLRRVADETAATETQAESCAHCGQPIRRVTGTLAAWWVHDPGGNTVRDWARAAASPRATPKRPPMDPVHILGIEADAEPAAGARQDGAQR